VKSNVVKSVALVVAGFSAGILVTNLPRANATGVATPGTDLAHKHFIVSVDEIRKNFVYADEFDGRYSRTVTLSDGTTRTIELIPMLHDGMQVVEFKDTGGHTYMGLNGTTTNGKLMVQVRDLDAMRAQLKQEGWSSPVGR
jgi:hypothetical protein